MIEYNTNPTKIWIELSCSRRVSSSCPTSGTHRVNLVTNLVISHEWGMDWEVFTISETYLWSFVTEIFHNGQPSHGFKLWTRKGGSWKRQMQHISAYLRQWYSVTINSHDDDRKTLKVMTSTLPLGTIVMYYII